MTHDEGVPALRADRLGKRYGRVWGLRDCTFSVPAGSVVGLVGPNGAGKTTLLSLTVGLLAPTEGEIVVFGETSRAHTADTLARGCSGSWWGDGGPGTRAVRGAGGRQITVIGYGGILRPAQGPPGTWRGHLQ